MLRFTGRLLSLRGLAAYAPGVKVAKRLECGQLAAAFVGVLGGFGAYHSGSELAAVQTLRGPRGHRASIFLSKSLMTAGWVSGTSGLKSGSNAIFLLTLGLQLITTKHESRIVPVNTGVFLSPPQVRGQQCYE